MLTDLEKLQRRAARLTAELDKARAKRDGKLTAMVRAGVQVAALTKEIKSLQRRCDRAVELVRQRTASPKRRPRPGAAAVPPDAASSPAEGTQP